MGDRHRALLLDVVVQVEAHGALVGRMEAVGGLPASLAYVGEERGPTSSGLRRWERVIPVAQVGMGGDPHLVEVGLAHHSPACVAGLPQCRQQQRDQQSDDCDHDQKLNQCEALRARASRAALRGCCRHVHRCSLIRRDSLGSG